MTLWNIIALGLLCYHSIKMGVVELGNPKDIVVSNFG